MDIAIKKSLKIPNIFNKMHLIHVYQVQWKRSTTFIVDAKIDRLEIQISLKCLGANVTITLYTLSTRLQEYFSFQ
jgi:hypothetical protein